MVLINQVFSKQSLIFSILKQMKEIVVFIVLTELCLVRRFKKTKVVAEKTIL